ncbi:hypothetical protein ACFW1F_13465 [Streptomyces bungoensis]|uniref:hypothetical protein n=1 Tax=Streptomyces bungoensis TaxID=285568 RepID=UPI00368B9868
MNHASLARRARTPLTVLAVSGIAAALTATAGAPAVPAPFTWPPGTTPAASSPSGTGRFVQVISAGHPGMLHRHAGGVR